MYIFRQLIYICLFLLIPISGFSIGSKADVALRYSYSFQFKKAEHTLNNLSPGWREFTDNKNLFIQVLLNEGPKDISDVTKRITDNLKKLKKENLPKAMKAHFLAESELMLGVLQMQDKKGAISAVHLFKSYNSYEKLLTDFPDYAPAQIGYRFLRIAIAVMPEQYKKFTSLLGMKGDLETDVQVLHNLLLEDKLVGIYRDEVIIMLDYLDLHYNLGQFVNISDEEKFESTLPLFKLVQSLHAFKQRNPKLALNYLKGAAAGNKANFLNYYMGKGYYILMDDRCESLLKKFIILNRSNGYVKSAAYYLSNYTLYKDRLKESSQFEKMVLRDGANRMGPDKLALQAIKYKRSKDMVLATLLYDSGEYDEAIKKLQECEPHGLIELVEVDYRLGNNYWELGRLDSAIFHFEKVFSNSRKLNLYFAPKAALKLGLHYKRIGDKWKAINHLDRVLGYKKFPFEKEIKSKAKYHLAVLSTDQIN